MSRVQRISRAALIVATVVMCGCALTGKSDPLTPRYFSPESTTRAPAAAARAFAGSELRLGRITASPYLGDRIVYRNEDHELGFYDDRRWSERPELYLRRALARSLYEQAGVARVVSGSGPTLEVDLNGFEEVRGPRPLARARATILLYDGRAVWREQTFTVERPIAAGPKGDVSAESSVRSLSDALAELVGQVAGQVLATLAAPPTPAAPPPERRTPPATGAPPQLAPPASTPLAAP